MATFEEQFKTNEAAGKKYVDDTFDTSIKNQQQALTDAYNKNAPLQENQQNTIKDLYGKAQYDIGVQNDRNDANLTQFANVRDMNTGLGSQHRLNLGNTRNAANAAVAAAQSRALEDATRQAELMKTMYQNNIASALANGEYKKAAAQLDEYNRRQQMNEENAQILASYGDMSGYNGIYGEDTANTMQTMWNAQNPETAYRLGRISANQYKNITGKWPRGYTPPSAGGYYGGGIPLKYKLAGAQSFNASKPEDKTPLMTLPDLFAQTTGQGLVDRLQAKGIVPTKP